MLSRLLILLLSITSIVDANVQCPTLQFRPEVIKNQAGTWTIQWSQLTPATTGGQVQFVDIHITRNAQQLNYRMNLSPYAYTDNNVQYYTFQDQPLALGETITYSFTYIVSWPDRNTIFGCDSTNFEFTVPGGNTVTEAPTTAPTTSPTCPTLTFDTRIEKNPAATWTVQWFQSSPSSTQGQVNSVDIHVTRGSGVASYIMTRSPYSYFPDHSVFYYTWETPGTQLQPGEHISYTFSYHVQSGSSEIVCTTQNFEFNVPNNAVTQVPTPSAQCPTLTFTSRIEKNPAATWTLQWFQATPSTTDGDVTAIDLHVTRTSGATTHVMTRSPYSYTPDHSVFYYTWETPGTGLQPGESLTYSFTYHVQISSGGEVACTTDTYEFTLPGVPASPQPRSCPVVTITSHVEDAAGRYTFIADAGINPDPIDWVDIHVMAASGFYNYRTQLSSHLIYELTLPVPLGSGENIGYYYTVKTGSLTCDTEKFSYTTPGTPAGNPTQGATPATGEICPVISFTQAITSQGGIYTVQLTPTTSRPIEWIDVHIKTNTDAEYHARMDAGYSKVLPSYITSASSATYYFTSSSQTTVCNSNTFVWNK